MGARSNQVYRRLPARALRPKTPPFAALFTPTNQSRAAPQPSRKRSAFQRSASDGCPEQPGVSAASRPRTPAQNASVCGSVHANQSEPRSAPTEPQAQRFPAERVGWVPGATRCIGGFPPAHSGPKRLRLRLCSRQPIRAAQRPNRAASAALSSGARRMGARSNQVYRRLPARALRPKTPPFAALFTPTNQSRAAPQPSRKRSAFQRSASDGCPEQPGVSAASRPRTPAQNASVCGSVHANQPTLLTGRHHQSRAAPQPSGVGTGAGDSERDQDK
jgi:hypothetical protein